ncbi:MAG TPA: DUF6687 family protein [Planctomycetota bacterium]|nr:DUF6687 family protein [Planctomycetota bacterium]
MNLPVRYQFEAGTERVISVDGAFDAPGLNLSHWPGHRTPPALRRDLSTEIALAFAALPERERLELGAGCTAIVNNHFDTDGNCALFALRHPELALPRAKALVETAAAGDFFQGASEQAFTIDCIVEALVDEERSPIAADLRGVSEATRDLRASEFLFGEFPRLLDGDTRRFEPLYAGKLSALRADVAELGRAAKDDITHLDLCVWSAPLGAASSRDDACKTFDPGRHALFRGAARDRALVIGPRRDGFTYRLVFSTYSWFDMVTRTCLPRPALDALARALNEQERLADSSDVAWRHQATASPSPELWFGKAQHPAFAEHCAVLAPSRLTPNEVRRTIVAALRDALLLPQ